MPWRCPRTPLGEAAPCGLTEEEEEEEEGERGCRRGENFRTRTETDEGPLLQ